LKLSFNFLMRLDDAAGRLRAGGRRVTAQRRAVWRALAALGCAADAEEIHRAARRLHPGIGRVTVYRALDALTAEGLAQTLLLGDGRTRYEATVPGRHHHHLVCLRCGRIATTESCAVRTLEGTVLQRGFQVTAHRLELFGYCARCRA
jgi:Fe2+ or Zn2+ uptake regulation protein